MNRYGLALCQRTHIAQKLPSDVGKNITSFYQFVICDRREFEFSLGQMGNMDEMPMFFDMSGTRTVHSVGDKTVTHFTVILACMAGGTKLKPAVVFKRKTMPKEKYSDGICV